MKKATAAEYRAMAEECFRWAREAKANEVCVSLRQLAQIWLDAASKLDGLPPTQTQSSPESGSSNNEDDQAVTSSSLLEQTLPRR